MVELAGGVRVDKSKSMQDLIAEVLWNQGPVHLDSSTFVPPPQSAKIGGTETCPQSAGLQTRLEQSANSGEIVIVYYAGGSNPGSGRELCLLNVNGNRFDALDIGLEEERTYRVDRIIKIRFSDGSWYKNRFDPVAKLPTLERYVKAYDNELRSSNWLPKFDSSMRSLKIFHYPEGKRPIRKDPDVWVRPSGQSERPWKVTYIQFGSFRSQSTDSVPNLHLAMEDVISFCRRNAY